MKEFNFDIFKPQQQRFSLALALAASLVAHLLLAVFIMATDSNKPLPKKEKPHIMDVVLLDESQKESKKINKDARVIANKNAVGSRRNAEDKMTRKAKAPMPPQPQQAKPKAKPKQPPKPKLPPKPPVNSPPEIKPLPKVKPEQPKEVHKTLVTKRSEQPIYKKPVTTERVVKKQPKVKKETPIEKPQQYVPLANLMPSAMALSQLSQDFERERRMKQSLNREAYIPMNTRQVKYAHYARSLVHRLENQWRPGKAQYEKYSDKERSVSIKITIEHDGSLGGIEIVRPSPIPEINESAVKAIQAAAPFKGLPSSWGLDRAHFFLIFEVVENGFVFRSM